MVEEKPSGVKKRLLKLRDSGKMKSFLVFLVFVGIAAVFWTILALNDESQDTVEVSVRIQGVPDSVTFISNPPQRLLVVVRDKGVKLLRHTFAKDVSLTLNFEEFESGNRFRVSHNALMNSLRHLFGSEAVISSFNPDSISFLFTREPGRLLPIELTYDVTAAPGMVVQAAPQLSDKTARLFSVGRTDTIRRLFTDKVTLRNLDKTTTVSVPLVQIPGTRTVPAAVDVTFTVEQLVRKESEVAVNADNIPLNNDILFFPAKVKVSYYVPMSRYNSDNDGIEVTASYNEAVRTSSDKVGIRVTKKAPYVSSVELHSDSVEYSLVQGYRR